MPSEQTTTGVQLIQRPDETTGGAQRLCLGLGWWASFTRLNPVMAKQVYGCPPAPASAHHHSAPVRGTGHIPQPAVMDPVSAPDRPSSRRTVTIPVAVHGNCQVMRPVQSVQDLVEE